MRSDTQFDIHYVCDPPRAQVRISGEVDLASDRRVRDTFTFLQDAGCLRLELDLTSVTFIDAYSLGLLSSEQHRLRALGGGLEVVAASLRCLRVAELARYDGLRPPVAN